MREHPTELIALLMARSMRLNCALWDALAQHLAQAKPPFAPELRSTWLMILLSALRPERNAVWLETAIEKGSEGDLSASLALFEYLISPRLEFRQLSRPGTEGPALVRATIILRSDHYSLNEAWQKGLRPHIDKCATPLAMLLSNCLTQAHLQLRAAFAAHDRFDPESWGTSCD